MAIINNDNIDTRAPKAQDNRHGKFVSGLWKPFDTVADALATVTTYRHEGLTLPIRRSTDKIDLYWFQGGILNSNFVLYKPEVALQDYYTKTQIDSFINSINADIDSVLTTATNIQSELDNHEARVDNPHAVTKTQVGLGNVDNTSDLNKPLSTATITALSGKENTLPTGTSLQYFKGDKTLGTLDKTAVGLSNVDNTSDVNKPVSTAQQTAINLKANINSPSLTGVPLAPTASPGTNTTQLATTAFVTSAITGAAMNLQGVTNLGNDTTNAVWFTGFSNQGVIRKGLIIGEGGLTQYNPIAFPSASKVWDLTYDGSTNVSLNYYDGGTDGTTIYLTNQSPSVAGVQLREPGTSNINRRVAIGNGINLNEAVNLGQLNGKQNTLISGTNIRTINGTSLLGSGDISITSTTPDATTTVKGIVKLAGDLGGTADVPTVPSLATKAPINSPTFTGTVNGITKFMINLGNVDNTADIDKPISTATQTALNLKANASSLSLYQLLSEKNQANGYVGLDGTVKIPSIYLPSYVDDILEFANVAAFPATGETGKVYIALDTNKTYRWSGSAYVEVSPSDVNSVNGLVGIINLTTTNIPEGTNLYHTIARVNAIVDPKLATGQTIGANTTGNAATVTDGVVTTGSYANPGWITSLAYAKITGVPAFALDANVIHTTGNETKTGRLTLATPVAAAGSASISPLIVTGGKAGANTATTGTVTSSTAPNIDVTSGAGGDITGITSGTALSGAGGKINLTAGDGGNTLGTPTTSFPGNGGDVIAQGGGSYGGVAGSGQLKAGNNYKAGGIGGDIWLVPGWGNNISLDDMLYNGTIWLGRSPGAAARGNTVVGATVDDRINRFQVTGDSKFTGKAFVTIAPTDPTGVMRLSDMSNYLDKTSLQTFTGSKVLDDTDNSGDIVSLGAGSATSAGSGITVSTSSSAYTSISTNGIRINVTETTPGNIESTVLMSNSIFYGAVGAGRSLEVKVPIPLSGVNILQWPIEGGTKTIATREYTTGVLGSYLPLTGGTLTGALIGTTATFSGNITQANGIVTGAAANNRGYYLQTAGVNRWSIVENNTAESGSNVGSDFAINRWSDAGSLLGTALSINRSTGNSQFSGTINATQGSFVFAGATLRLQSTTGTGNTYIDFLNNVGTRNSFIGHGTASNNDLYYSIPTVNTHRFITNSIDNFLISGTLVSSKTAFRIERTGIAAQYTQIDQEAGACTILAKNGSSAGFSQTIFSQGNNTTDREMARFDGSGNFIIGDTTAIHKFKVVSLGNTGFYSSFLYGENWGTMIGTNEATSTRAALNVVAGVNQAGSGGTSLLYVRGDGNVGVGIIAPTAKLHVVGTGLFTGTLTGTSATFSSTVAATTNVSITDAAGTTRGVFIKTGANNRWLIFTDTTAESGSDAGSNFGIASYTDAGAFLGNPLSINRATSLITVAANISAATAPTIGAHLTNKTYTDGLLAAGLGVNTVSAAASLTLSARGYYTFNGTTTTWTFPTLASNVGMLYRIINMGSGNLTLSAGTNEIYDSGVSSTTLVVGATVSLSIYNNGVKWVVLG